MSIKALIPVRSGSVRVKNKNIRPFAGSSLLEIKIKQMQRIQAMGLIDGVVVNSNCDGMLALAKQLGAECVKRDERFARSETSANDMYADVAKHLDSDDVLFVDCTNPMLNDQSIINALEQYEGIKHHHCTLNSAHLIKEFLWKQVHHINVPINYQITQIPRSQDLPEIFALNFAINILSREYMMKYRTIVGNNPYLFLLDEVESLDIDNEIDFTFAEFLFLQKQSTPPPPK